jgi:hypothetical protein
MKSIHRLLIPALLGALALPALQAAPKASGGSTQARASSAQAAKILIQGNTLESLVAWAKSGTSDEVHTVFVHAVSNQANTTCSYGWARLSFKAQSNSLESGGPTGKRFFSDRLWGTGTGLGASMNSNPFDPAKTDPFGVTMHAGNGSVKLLLGNSAQTLTGKWEKGLFHGFAGTTAWILSFKKDAQAIPK